MRIMNRGVRAHKAPTQGWQGAPSAPRSSCFGELKPWVILIEGTVSMHPTKEVVTRFVTYRLVEAGCPNPVQ